MLKIILELKTTDFIFLPGNASSLFPGGCAAPETLEITSPT